jgi:hypothetical protein
MLTFLDKSDPEHEDRMPFGRVNCGALNIAYEEYPNPVTDPLTGFRLVDAGVNPTVHVNHTFDPKDQSAWAIRMAFCNSLARVAWQIENQLKAEPCNLISVTHVAMARLACMVGFRHFAPDQSIISPETHELMEALFNKFEKDAIGFDKSDRRIHVVFLPLVDLRQIFKGPGTIDLKVVRNLTKLARKESTALKQTAAS